MPRFEERPHVDGQLVPAFVEAITRDRDRKFFTGKPLGEIGLRLTAWYQGYQPENIDGDNVKAHNMIHGANTND